MPNSLLFIPDISGFTKFVQTTEADHSQHVIAELLEVLIKANTQDLKLAEVEGDALFFYKEGSIPSQEKLLAQIETMFTAFYSHLQMLEKNRICPCRACASAPDLELKIIAHSGDLQFIEVQGNKKPFGPAVIETHRLLKNSVQSDHYALISKALADQIGLSTDYKSNLYDFAMDADQYDGHTLSYLHAEIAKDKLVLRQFPDALPVTFDCPPNFVYERYFPVEAPTLLEYITNYRNRSAWVEGVDEFKFNENEVTRLGTEHTCVIDGKLLDFVTVTKEVLPGQLVYGEMSTSPPPVDTLHQFFVITPMPNASCKLSIELYWHARSPIKKLMIALLAKKVFKKNTKAAVDKLWEYISEKYAVKG